MRRILTTMLLVFAWGALGGSPTATAQSLPPSLEGESFIARESTEYGNIGQTDMSFVCGAFGQTVTGSYTASGVASGPYPGTFTESGTVRATQTGGTSYPLIAWDATFHIDSPAGQVSGSKSLLFGQFGCAQGPASTGLQVANAAGSLTYSATIKTPEGTFTDRGEASGTVDEQCIGALSCAEPVNEVLHEFFYLSTGVLPVDMSGKATGGGQLGSAANPLERVTFGFNARMTEDGSRLQGHCNVIDHATRTYISCLDVVDYQQIGNTATWSGRARVNGVTEQYRITVADNGEPNRGLDTFSIVTESYDAAGPLINGNVQVHQTQ